MDIAASPEYDLLERINEHGPFSAYRARNTKSGVICFLKSVRFDRPDTVDGFRQHVLGALRLQNSLRNSHVIKAIRVTPSADSVLVEYPWLDRGDWIPASEITSLADLTTVLVKVCFVLDYLHQFDFVHGDAKLHNFMVSRRSGRFHVRAGDLELLCRDGSIPHSVIFGSPEHIAPEILANDRIVCQSDQYSIGVSLGKLLDSLSEAERQAGGQAVANLLAFKDQLCQPDYHQRPRHLLDACYRNNLIDSEEYSRDLHLLLRSTLITRLRQQGRPAPRTTDALNRLLVESLRLHGLTLETVDDYLAFAVAHPTISLRTALKLAGRTSLRQVDNFWFLAASDTALADRYLVLDSIFRQRMSIADRSREEVEAEVAEYARTHQFEKAYLLARLQLQTCLDDRTGEQDASLCNAWSLLAVQSLSCLGRYSDAYDLNRDALARLNPSTPEYGQLLGDTILAAYRGMRQGDIGWAWEAIDRFQETCGEAHQAIEMRRYRIWRDVFVLPKDIMLTQIADFIEQCRQRGLTRLMLIGRYAEAIVEWRTRNFPRALEILRAIIDGPDGGETNPDIASALSMAALTCYESSQYDEAIAYAKRAVALATMTPQSFVLPQAFSTLVYAYARSGQIRKADYWLLKMMQIQDAGFSRDKILWYYNLRGAILSEQGRLQEARNVLDRCLSDMHDYSGVVRPSVCTLMARVAWLSGDSAAFSVYAAKVRESAVYPANLLAKILNLLELLNASSPGGQVDLVRLKTCTEDLCSDYDNYYGAIGTLHLFAQRTGNLGPITRRNLTQLASSHASVRPILYLALGPLLECYQPTREADPVDEIAAWKSAFNVLHRGHNEYFAMLAALTIARIYKSIGKFSHARKFLILARSLSRGLQNAAAEAVIAGELARGLSESPMSDTLIESFHVMSELVKDVTNYRETLAKMVRFAAELTGAERAILFLSRGGADASLEIAASVNCDDKSLSELAEFSSTLPRLVARDQGTLVIDDALQSPETRELASVVRHNILSVACIPLFTDGGLQAVLYLDHHTIPALFDPEDLRYVATVGNFMTVVLAAAREVRGLTLLNRRMQEQIAILGGEHAFVTADKNMTDLLETLPRLAQSTASVLIQGESGTGKEIICEFLHTHSLRSKENLVKVNCAAISPTLMESELFGIAKGVATGVGEREGKFVAADRGTLYLDEIGDMPLDMQGKILRAVEYQQFERVGSNRPIKTDIRFICGTNADLRKLVDDGKFRKDLFYRINTVVVEIPPLRKRPGDIPLLIEHFAKRFAPAGNSPRFSESAQEALIRYGWPGNVRELKNLVERTCIYFSGKSVDIDDLPQEIVASLSSTEPEAKDALLKARICRALTKSRGNQTGAAQIVGMAVTTLRRHMARFGISSRDFQ